MGRISLPLSHSQAMELKSRCEQAPYGRREETIVDTSVRNAWQLDASRLTIGRRIQEVVASLIPRLANGLPRPVIFQSEKKSGRGKPGFESN